MYDLQNKLSYASDYASIFHKSIERILNRMDNNEPFSLDAAHRNLQKLQKSLTDLEHQIMVQQGLVKKEDF
jgi:hypothetical protein